MSAPMVPHTARLAGAVLAAAIAVVGAGEALDEDAFALGVLRRDGIVIPFATFDGRRWHHNWPEPRATVDVPAAVRDVPERWWGSLGAVDAWQAWIGGEPPRTLHVRQPDWFEAQCVQQVGLRTDYRPSERPPGPDAQPYPKDGLAISPPRRVEAVAVVPSDQVEVTPDIRAAFNKAEHDAFDNGPFSSRVFGGRRQRDPQPITVEAAYAVGDPGATRVYYLELVRDYSGQTPADARCAVAFAAGFFARDGDGAYRVLSIDAAIAQCDRNEIHYMLPLGAIRSADRLFWIGQWSGWDFEEYNVFEIKAKKVESVAHAWGGGC